MKQYILFDIGGTMIKYGIMDENEKMLESLEVPTEAKKGGPHIIEKIKNIIKEYRKKYELHGICISTAGMVDYEEGKIIYANENIPNYKGTAIKEILEGEFSIPCEVENDVICAGLSEHYCGASKGSKSSVCVTIGTGIGGCVIIDNKVVHGASNSAGEIGYMNLFGSKFELLASTSALVKKVEKRISESGKEIYREKPVELNGKVIFEMAKTGDEICRTAIEEMCDILGYGIANICYVVNPEVVVLGGGITKQKDYLYPLIRNSLVKYLISAVSKSTKLAFAANGNKAGMLGAYYNFMERQKCKVEG
jgi:predicted NBD/HSP70 family sugar kinase